MQKRARLSEFRFSLGDITLSIEAIDSKAAFTVDPARQRFSTTHKPDIALRLHNTDTFPSYEFKETIFASGGLWNLFRSQGRYILCGSSEPEGIPQRMLVISPDYRSGDIYLNRKNGEPDSFNTYPLEYPLDEVLMINLLSSRQGALIHACGIKEDTGGIAFIGSSGAGKSTLSNLYKGKKEVTALSDDRIIIRKREGEFWMYGTPWHGDAKVCSPERVPLRKIFFLKHAQKNSTKEMTPMEATRRLIINSFLPFWDKPGMEFTLKFCAELTKKVPCYELGFFPDASVLSFIRSEI